MAIGVDVASRADRTNEDHALIRSFVILSAFFVVATGIFYVLTISWTSPIPRDGTGLVVGRDFLNFWMYGRAASMPDPGRFYDSRIYNGELAAMLGSYLGHNWAYPPSIMLVAAPFGQMSYLAALACWTGLSGLTFLLVAREYLNDLRLLIAVALCPAAIFCLISGQSSLLTAAMLIAIFAWLDRRPISSGVLIGLLTLKPQLGLLLPIMLIASRRWRVIAAAVITTMLIMGLTTALWGTRVWVDFVHEGIPTQYLVFVDPNLIAAPFKPTVFGAARLVGAGYDAAMAIQYCVTAAAVVAVFWASRFRSYADPRVLMALFLACSVSASPYLLSYDLLALTFAALMLLESGTFDAAGRVLARLVYWLPLLTMLLGTRHVPGAALVAPAFALYLLMRLKEGSKCSPL
jgi:hypothetical protein